MAKRGILIVEDNEINREMLKDILSEKYRVIEAKDGLEGMEKLRENIRNLSLVLLDVQMPNMNGYEFLELCSNDEILSNIPIIVTTGSGDDEDEERCLSLGAADFVTKPYNPRIILCRIAAVIRLKESIATLEAIEHDSLSGLYTKDAFYLYAKQFIEYSDKSFDMLMINVLNFSYINVRYGETAADMLLKHISKRILEYDDSNVISCRYNADRFVLMREHTKCSHYELSKTFDAELHRDSPIPDFTVKYAVYDNVPNDVPISELCDRLTITVDTVKNEYETSLAFYDNEIVEKTNRLRIIGDTMENALENGQFVVFYQPKHNAKDGKISGAEALVRWIHPELGFISPGDFIPLFEKNGFITNLDLYVWRTVCKDIKSWQESGIVPVPVSVNASRRDFTSVVGLEPLFEPIAENGIDKKYLHLEITESLGISDASILEKVKKIKESGIKIELDDFGAGHSSLGTICDIPMDIIKLDIGFVRALDRQKEIVRTIISMAHALNLKTVAEGVETKEHIEILRELGCDCFQGFYFSKPIDEKSFREYLMCDGL